MAKFLTTTGLSYQLEQVIKSAKERLILISPYLKVNDRIRDLLEDRDRLKLDVRIVYGKSELQPEEVEWLKGLRSVRVSYSRNLHAKCYLNEEAAIVTSMNLYEFSQVNNDEMGVLATRVADPELFKDIYDECQRLLRTSEEVQITVEKVKKGEVTGAGERRPTSARPARTGACIRCGTEVPLNRKKPYCAQHYESWARYSNEDYEDTFCHGCGKAHPASMRKPLCPDCYSKVA